jgi:hypothetical protein
MRPGETMTHASVVGSTFDGRIVAETTIVGRPAIVPAIRGRAWTTGITQVLVDPATLLSFFGLTTRPPSARSCTSHSAPSSCPASGRCGRG